MNNVKLTVQLHVILIIIVMATFINVNDVMGCSSRWIKMAVNPELPKQGDIVNINITVGKSSEVESIKYKVNYTEYNISSVPYSFNFNTCKTTGNYYTSLILWGEVTYTNGKVRTCAYEYNLTVSPTSRENSSLKYVFYLAISNDLWQFCGEDGAAGFINEFDSYSGDYRWLATKYAFEGNCNTCASNSDLVIAWGHGTPHHFNYLSSNWLDLSTTSYGGFSHCNSTGDPECIAFASCRVLSMNDYGSNEFWYYWFNQYSTRLDKRPFQGVHVILGFRTDMVIDVTDYLFWKSTNADDFFINFAQKLDNGHSYRYAWMYAAIEELDFSNGDNKAAVIYINKYKYDKVSSSKDDYIYGSSNYYDQWIEYW